MAAALEVYGAHTEVEDSHTGDTDYVQGLRCTVDRSAKAGAKNFIVIAHIAMQTGDYLYTWPIVKLEQDDTTVIGETEEFNYAGNQGSNRGFTYNFVRRVSLDNSEHTLDLDYKLAGSTNITVYMETASIAVIEESANTEYAEQIAEVGSDSDTVYTDFVTLTFTPASEQNYVIFGAGEVELNDESDSNAEYCFRLDTTVFCGVNQGYVDFIGAGNDDDYHTVGCAAIKNLDTSEHSITLSGKGADTDNVKCKRAAIVAIPIGDFENVYSDSQARSTKFTGTSYQDTALSMSQAVNAADHLILAGLEISNESIFYAGNAQLIADTVTSWLPNLDDRLGDSGGFYMQMIPLLLTLESGTKTFKVQARSDSALDTEEAQLGEAYLIVIEIPAGVAPPAGQPYTSRVQGVQGMRTWGGI